MPPTRCCWPTLCAPMPPRTPPLPADTELAGAIRVLARARFADARGLKAFAGSGADHPRQRQENRCAASAYQKPAPGRRRLDVGADVAARLARRPTTLRCPPHPQETGTAKPNDTCSTNSSANCTTACKPASSTRTPGVSAPSPARCLTFNFVRCLLSGSAINRSLSGLRRPIQHRVARKGDAWLG